MGFCVPVASQISCGSIAIFRWVTTLFLPSGISPIIYLAILFVFSSVVIYLLAAMLGKIGGIILMAIGVLGALVTFGASLVLTAFGLILIFLGNPKLLLLLNTAFFALCFVCYGI